MSDGSRTALSKSTFHFAAGLGSGVLSAVLLQPIDLLKTRVQQSGAHSLTAAIAEIRAAPRLLPALWRGAVPSALRTGFGSAIYFTSLNAIRQSAATHIPSLALPSSPSSSSSSSSAAAPSSAPSSPSSKPPSSSSLPKLSNTGNLVSGAAARSLAGLILMPLTVLKVRYESTLYNYGSLASAARDIARAEGLRGFFAGYGATAVRDAPYAGLYVLFYEQSKKRLSSAFGATTTTSKDSTNNGNTEGKEAGGGSGGGSGGAGGMGLSRAAGINFASGVVAGVVCSVVSNPFDAVKTRIQLQPGRYRNLVQAARRMVREEGFRALLDGLALRMSRKALSSALAWTVYEELVRRAERTWSARPRRTGTNL